MRLLLSENLPLRTTRMLGDYAEDRVLPHRIGDMRETRFHLVKLSDTEWFAADHAMEVTEVQIDDAAIASWQQELRSDDAGRTWTVVVLGAPAPQNSSVSASGVGVRDPVSGRVIENPAEIMEYVLRLAGRTESFPMLRAECAAHALKGAGSLDVLKSIRAWLDEIAYSFAAIWTPDVARLYPIEPPEAGGAAVLTFDVSNAEQILSEGSIDDTADVVRVRYNLDETDDRALRYVELSTRPYRFDGVTSEVTLTWLRTPANAESVGRRMLQRMAGALTISLSTSDVAVRPCEWRQIVAHPEWMYPQLQDPVAMVTAGDIAPDEATSEIVLDLVLLPLPAIHVTASSIALPIGAGAAVDVSISNGIATFGVSDASGKPLINALVALDGGAPKKTNAQGKVSFAITPTVPPTKHELDVEAAGYTPFFLEVFL